MKPLEVLRRRMTNTRLTGAPFDSAAETVRWHGAMQGQDYGPAKWSIGQRTNELVDEDIDRELDDGAILRTHALRPTWHLLTREDIRWVLALTGPRVHRQLDRRFDELGLDPKTLTKCEKKISIALQGDNPLTRREIAGILEAAKIDPSGQRLPFILIHCELESVICSGRLAGKQQTFALLDDRAPAGPSLDRDEAMTELLRRYLQSHGPATVADFRWWSGLTGADIKKTLHALGSDVTSEELGGMIFWSLAGDHARLPAMRVGHLLQMLDEAFVAYTESRHFGDPRAVEARSAWSDRGMPAANVLLRGSVAGHWKRTLGAKSMAVELILYEEPRPADLRAMNAAAKRLGSFIGLPVTVSVTQI
jgi:hypothetical protein